MRPLFAVPLLCALWPATAVAQAPETPSAAAVPAAAPVRLVPFDSSESMRRLERSRHKADFFRLGNHFESQQNIGFCGPTTAVIVLNALRADRADIAKPRDERLFPDEFRAKLPAGLDPVYSRYTQGAFFDERLLKVKPKEQFYGAPKSAGARPSPGLELRELGEVLRNHDLEVQIRVVDDALADKRIRQELADNLARGGDYVVVNYSRPALGQRGGGHISPLGAYDRQSDSFLVLDVNPNGQPWVWVPTPALVASMRTRDANENRGYLLVREGKR